MRRLYSHLARFHAIHCIRSVIDCMQWVNQSDDKTSEPGRNLLHGYGRCPVIGDIDQTLAQQIDRRQSATAPLDSQIEGAIGSGSGYGDQLVYPKGLSGTERVAARSQLEPLPVELAQQLLDELAGRMAANAIHLTPLAYLRGLVRRAQTGDFTPEVALQRADRVLEIVDGSLRP